MVCEDWNSRPMAGRATLATDRLRLATAATRMRASSTSPWREGAPDDSVSVFTSRLVEPRHTWLRPLRPYHTPIVRGASAGQMARLYSPLVRGVHEVRGGSDDG